MDSLSYNYLKSMRIEKGLSTKDMAGILHIKIEDYQKLENSSNDLLTIGQCKLISVGLSVNPLELINLIY